MIQVCYLDGQIGGWNVGGGCGGTRDQESETRKSWQLILEAFPVPAGETIMKGSISTNTLNASWVGQVVLTGEGDSFEAHFSFG